ncbi:hypothetical protein BXZ70DRAFT_1008156 [Cristinia sonorae]|uniref:Uncharacterized protein n=1 Tax=Cristinia sonorae TaxID=1940300 RepID=A0A8K0UQY6_9AGAR|nr:hypothetical protein BXZ70DRAFT_1008156 [Cristinia sonorae]
MAVRKLVGRYEALEPEGDAPRHRKDSAPSPARTNGRFIRHPLLTADYDIDAIDGLPLLEPTSLTNDDDSMNDHSATTTEGTSQIRDPPDLPRSNGEDEGLIPEKYTAESLGIRKRTPANSRNASEAEAHETHEMHALIPTLAYTSARLASSEDTFVPSQHSASRASSSTLFGTSRVIQPPLGPHKPIPASDIFKRNAAPLYLPQLDDYLATLPAPSFPDFPHKGKGKEVPMFPPMDQLAASGRTIEDLESNSEIPPWWRNRDSIFGTLKGWALGLTGSSALASYYSLHGLLDTIQIFALLLNTIVPHKGVNLEDKWRQILLGTIPNILALNLATSTLLSLTLLLLFMLLAGTLLYFFWKKTSLCCSAGPPEGLQRVVLLKSNWSLVFISFFLTILYLPLSTMAVHVLVWSEDLWVVPNPYINATSYPPRLPSLGPPDQFRDPLDFCWTTTMQRDQVNYAAVIIIMSLICVAGLTVWFPLYVRRIVKRMAPVVDKYTELGRLRSPSEMDREYQRLLVRDRNPLTFLYDDYRRGWATYEAVTLFAKCTTLLLTAIVDPDNCLFRTLTRNHVAIARQILLLIAMLAFFLSQCFLAPFLDPVNNASEWTSRLNFVLTSALSLAIALNVPGQNFLDGPFLYIIYVVTYGLSLYFSIINTGPLRRLMKKLTRRIDFSIDIFSPRLDISPSSHHTKRRIWQEAITTLFLTSPECAIPKKQRMVYAQAKNLEYPPYLYDFCGTPGERHIENLKIIREVGSTAYSKGVGLLYGPDHAWFKYLVETIQTHYVGPDCYWKDPQKPELPGCTKFFGNAWWVPFPPTLVIRYDDGPLAVLREVAELEHYISQNSSDDIKRRREIRMTLRALDGKAVSWPYDHIEMVGSRKPWCCGRRYNAQTKVHFRSAMFHLKRRGHHMWEGTNIGSGFDVELVYTKHVHVDGSVIGLNDDYDLTHPLAHFLSLNQALIPGPLHKLESTLRSYRQHCIKECAWKADTLTYRFLSLVYNRPREPDGLAQSSIEHERDLRVRQLMLGSEMAFDMSYKRLSAVATTEIATWWYIFWDDLWRRNHDTISGIQKHISDFSPHYPTSIAYTPLPRAALEAFLIQRGLLNKKPKFGDFFTAGVLNKIYLRMNDIVFHRSNDANIIHLGDETSEMDMEDVDARSRGLPSTLGTGGGTDHDDADIRARPLYRWEGILDDKLSPGKHPHVGIWVKFGVWFGITPLWRSGEPSPGLALDVRLDTATGRYVLLRNDLIAPPGASKFV